MMSTFQKILDVLNDNEPLSDSRMGTFLVKSPIQFISLLLIYLLCVLKIGPGFMKDRKPFSLKPIIVLYNLIQIFLNLGIFISSFPILAKMNWACNNPDTSNSALNLLEIKIHYWYLFLKYFDLIETFFYVLRKKDRQVSFLHLYHHIGILMAAYISGKYFPGGQAIYVAFYNSLIHAIMYFYYLISSMSPNGALLWWKKYVTGLQIVQHCAIFLSVFPVVFNPNCGYPKFWMGAFSLNVGVIIYLFVKFYRNTYLNKIK